MCIAILSIGNAIPTREELVRSCAYNPDGFGYAFLIENNDGTRSFVSSKSMVADEAIDNYLSHYEQYAEVCIAHVFHARIATHGAVDINGVHPFAISNEKSLLIHNGVLDVTIAKSDWRSDSRVFAEDYLPSFGGARGINASRVVFDVLDGFVSGCNSKVIILSAESDVEPVTILGESLGHWDYAKRDIWFSNSSYKPASTYGYTSSAWNSAREITALRSAEFDALDDCDWYGSRKRFTDEVLFVSCVNADCEASIEDYEVLCDVCKWCQDCQRDSLACVCEFSANSYEVFQ